MPYVFIDDDKLKDFDPEGKLKQLPSDTAEKMERLESKANELLGEKKTLQLQYEEYKVESKKKYNELYNSKGAEESDKLQSMLNDAKEQLSVKDKELADYVSQVQQKSLADKATMIANEMTKDKNRADLLADKIKSRLSLDGDDVVVLDEAGKPTISSVDELSQHMRATYPFLVDGNPASGGGASGGSGGAAPIKKFNEYSPAELVELRRADPMKYDEIKAAQ